MRNLLSQLGRRSVLRGIGGLVGAGLLRKLAPIGVAEAAAGDGTANLYYGGTDGWISLPTSPAIGPFHPDNLAPAPFSTYIFGFRNLTGLTKSQISQQKLKAQHNAPIFWIDQFDGTNEFKLDLTNLGLGVRPDLVDSHTLHFHGFRNVIPFFDGEPTASVSVPVGRVFRYLYRPRDPGTYMFHCHVEDVEHVHMGMTSLVFVRPLQNGNTALYPSGKYAYNDGDGSTGYDREFVMFLSEVWAEAHWADSHIQLPEWSDYRADFSLLNGRVYPDTLAPNGSIDPFHPVRDASGDLIAPAGRPDLQYQPLSALVRCNAGERVLLRFANLGFKEAAMTLAGLEMRVVGKDATPMRGRDGTDTSFRTNSVSFGAGESIDAIVTAPNVSQPTTFVLFNRSYSRANNLDGSGYGGQRTELRVYPAGTLPPQTIPNT